MGWLRIAQAMARDLQPLYNLVNDVRAAGYTHVLLLGMGGSSLAPEVFRKTFGVLKMAQALGDGQALREAGRRVVHFHLGSDVLGGLKQLMGRSFSTQRRKLQRGPSVPFRACVEIHATRLPQFPRFLTLL